MSESTSEIPVRGLNSERFYPYHITAIACIGASLVGVVVILHISFKYRLYKSFFQWTLSDRFVVYIAACDGLFNLSHVLDHVQMVVTRSHVHPRNLCVVYAFLVVVFTTAQGLLVSAMALNSFCVVHFGKPVNFGSYDWKLHTFIFGIPTVEASLAVLLNKLGPTGLFCGIQERVALMVMTTVPATLILVVTCSLYVIIWCRIRREIRRLQSAKQALKHNATKIMTLFVTAYVFQWSSVSASGMFSFHGEVFEVMDYFVITTTNLGGVFNGIAFLAIQVMRVRQKNMVIQPKLVPRHIETGVTKF